MVTPPHPKRALALVGVDPRLRGVALRPDADFQRGNASLAIRLAETVLPRLVALGDIDEDELIFSQAAANAAAHALELPPALDGLERRLALAPWEP